MDRPHKNKFIIYASGRTGSTLLSRLLDSHPDIKCEGELFNPDVFIKSEKILGLLKFLPILYPEYRRLKGRAPVYGFKLIPYVLLNPCRNMASFYRYGWKIIHLERQNLLNMAISAAVAKITGLYKRSESYSSVRLRIAPEDLLCHMVYLEDQQHEQRKILKGWDPLTLSYESDLEQVACRIITSRKLCDFLGVAHRLLSTNMQRTHRRPYHDIIENYDDIMTILRLTRFRTYLP